MSKQKKEFMVIGVGQFGRNLISTLYSSDVELLVIDKDPLKLEEVASMATEAVCADASMAEVLNQFDIKAFDGAVVTMGDCMEDSVKVIMHLKEMGMPFIMAKATSDFEGRIYRRLGADKVIFPEREVGIRLGKQIAYGNEYDMYDVSDNYGIIEVGVPDEWCDKSIMELQLRSKHGLNIIGIRRDGGFEVNPVPETVLDDEDTLVVLGSNADVQKFINRE